MLIPPTLLAILLTFLLQNPPVSMSAQKERTFIAIKPDGVQRGIVGEVIKRFELKGFKLVALKMVTASEEHLKIHYKDLAKKSFFPGLVKYMASGPIVAMVSWSLNQVPILHPGLGRVERGENWPSYAR